MNSSAISLFTFILTLLFLFRCISPEKDTQLSSDTDPLDNYVDWSIYRGDKRGNQYADLAQIHAANVHKLQPVWQYRTGDANESSSMQVNPIIVDGLLYISTSTLNAVALDAKTGEEVWVFESSIYNSGQKLFRGRTRGVVYWQSEDQQDKRIFHFVKDRVYALDARTGKLIKDFGENGFIDLRKNLGMDFQKASVEVTNPGIVYKDFLIVISRVPEGYDSTPGHIRAFDASTGEFRWIFHTIPKEGEFGYDTWEFQEGETYGGANAWGGLTVDEKRGWVFCATGSPAYDFYGANRKGQNLFGNCVLALDATTGKRIWHYQTVHHDLWDYDNPPAPILVTIKEREEERDAVVQFTKMGLTYVLDRETGEPIFPVDEMPVPASNVEGEQAWPTQPIPRLPPPLSRLGITEADLTDITPEARAHALKIFRNSASGVFYTPPTTTGTIVNPGHQGGVEWGGGAFDPYSNIIYVNSNNYPTRCRLIKVYEKDYKAENSELASARNLYIRNCSACHGVDRKGVPPLYPALDTISKSNLEIVNVIKDGRNIMPGFPQLTDTQVQDLASYLKLDKQPDTAVEGDGKYTYVQERYERFVDDRGYPAVRPPWGKLTAIDLGSGKFVWSVPLGEFPELVKKGIRNTGTPNFGGPVTTAGGIVFIAATADEKIRAFNKINGQLLWEHKLPAGGYATPSVFQVDGHQYLAIMAAGGGKNQTPSSDHLIVFALPEIEEEEQALPKDEDGWIRLFDGETLDGWVQMNGYHQYTVENGAIIGRTETGSLNSFLCSKAQFSNFILEADVMVDTITNQGIQFRSSARPVTEKDHPNFRAGRVWGPQVEIRQKMGEGVITTGVLYGEALGTGWLSSEEKMKDSHSYFVNNGWNRIRLVADGPRIQTFVNGQKVEDITNEEVYKTHPKGFIALQVHGIEGERQFMMGWRNIQVKPL